MFEHNNFSSLLNPPKGYKTEGVLLLTYSLNLTMLNEVLLANRIDNPMPDVIRCAVQEDRRAGSLNESDATRRALLAFYNGCLKTVKNDDNRSFHHKLWAFLYTSEEDLKHCKMLRLIISSRNLTRQNMREGVVCLEGNPKSPENGIRRNEAVLDVLETAFGDDIRSNNVYKAIEITDFTDCVRKIIGDEFATYRFHCNKQNTPMLETLCNAAENSCSITIVSPFLGADEIKELCKGQDCAIITREGSWVANIKEAADAAGVKAFYLYKDRKSESKSNKKGNSIESTDKEETDIAFESFEQPLHAKVYAFDDSNESVLYIGSANFSKNGLTKNHELLLEIKSKGRKFSKCLRDSLGDRIKLEKAFSSGENKFPVPQYFSELEKNEDEKKKIVSELQNIIAADLERDELCRLLSIICGKNIDPMAPLDDALRALVSLNEEESIERIQELFDKGELESKGTDTTADQIREELRKNFGFCPAL